MSGFYLMYRGWLDHPAFGGVREPYCKRAAWAWLIERAKWKDTPESVCGKRVMLRRGQLSYSSRYLAEAWGWDDRKVRRFLTKCADEAMIVLDTAAGQITVTICNYDEYQLQENGSAADAPQNSRTTWWGGAANKNEGNEVNNRDLRDLPVATADQPEESGLAMIHPENDNPTDQPEKQKRGWRVPDGDLSDEWAAAGNQAREKAGMSLMTRRALNLRWADFQDYWRGVPGSRGLKADWLATWRNNCRDPRSDRRMQTDAPATDRPRPQVSEWKNREF